LHADHGGGGTNRFGRPCNGRSVDGGCFRRDRSIRLHRARRLVRLGRTRCEPPQGRSDGGDARGRGGHAHRWARGGNGPPRVHDRRRSARRRRSGPWDGDWRGEGRGCRCKGRRGYRRRCSGGRGRGHGVPHGDLRSGAAGVRFVVPTFVDVRFVGLRIRVAHVASWRLDPKRPSMQAPWVLFGLRKSR
jgi:hypothetical protein